MSRHVTISDQKLVKHTRLISDPYQLKPRGPKVQRVQIMATPVPVTPKAKRRKSIAGQGPLKEAVKSSLIVEEEKEWNGRELVLLQLPSNVCPSSDLSSVYCGHRLPLCKIGF